MKIAWSTGMIIPGVYDFTLGPDGVLRMVEEIPSRVVSDEVGRAVTGLTPKQAHAVAKALAPPTKTVEEGL